MTETAPARRRNPAASSETKEDQYHPIFPEKIKLQRGRGPSFLVTSVMDFHKTKGKEMKRLSSPGPYWIFIHSGETCEDVVCQSRIQKHQNGNFSKSAFKATFKVVFGV